MTEIKQMKLALHGAANETGHQIGFDQNDCYLPTGKYIKYVSSEWMGNKYSEQKFHFISRNRENKCKNGEKKFRRMLI